MAVFSSSIGIAPSTPICSRKYRLMMPRIENTIERGWSGRIAHLGAEVRRGVVAEVVIDRR